ncbi:MAG: class I SAM-dependent methyltransferase [Bryobacteraceae bacterium]|nr:class I SAM-dependent methyltransferase [Bryobacteraceae bacterium]
MTPVRVFVYLLFAQLTYSQTAIDTDSLWQDFLAWIKRQPGVSDIGPDKYQKHLIERGLTNDEATQRLTLISKLATERGRELTAAYMNKLYTSPAQTRFTHDPNAFLALAAKAWKPGKALDVAMGQGRNALYLARQGWKVTGYDIAEEGLRVAREAAAKAGVTLHTVLSTFEDFDYGIERWDLIYFVYTDAPVVDPAFARRIVAALKPGGYLLIERPFKDLDQPDPEWRAPLIEQDKPNALLQAYPGLRVLHYQDTMEVGDWQQTSVKRIEKQLRIVRLLARKP